MITLYGGDVVVLSRDDVRGRPTGEIKLHHLIGIQAAVLEKAGVVVLVENNGDVRYLKDRKTDRSVMAGIARGWEAMAGKP